MRYVDVNDHQGVIQPKEEMPEWQRKLPAHLQNYRIPWGPIGEPVYRKSYSQKTEDGRNESYPQTVVRAVDGNCSLVDAKFIEEGEREKLYELLLTFGGLPAGRHLNASGMKGRQFLFNCHASGWDPLEPGAHFTFLFDALMMGGGVGANYSNRYMESLPIVHNPIHLHIKCREDHPNLGEFNTLVSEHNGDAAGLTFQVPDSREGWVEAVDLIFEEAYAADGPSERVLTIDVSGIRARGMRLKTSGGIACGPGPLVTMLTDIVSHLNGCVGRKLTSLDAMTLDHTLAGCVIAGGKRRSSRMSVKSWRDTDIFEFIHCKRVDGVHWSTNISVEIDDDFTDALKNISSPLYAQAKRVMREVVLGKRTNGEPGLWNRSLSMIGERLAELMYCPNPCGEIGLRMWENCNLGHINLGAFVGKPIGALKEAFRLMTRWLVRATFGDIPSQRQREVVDENRRIGVGFFGFHEWLALNGFKYSDCWKNEWVINKLKAFREVVDCEAASYADSLGIPRPIKTTTLAPTGTVAILPGTTTGAQAMMAPWFKRLVRYSSMQDELAVKKLEGYEILKDDDVADTEIVVYWCEDPLVAKVRAAGFEPSEILEGQYDVPFEASLKVQAMLQDVWANNAISFTINLKKQTMPTEEEMEAALIEHLPRLKGTTVFAPVDIDGAASRKNVPIQPISQREFEAYTGRKERTMIEDECKGACPVK